METFITHGTSGTLIKYLIKPTWKSPLEEHFYWWEDS